MARLACALAGEGALVVLATPAGTQAATLAHAHSGSSGKLSGVAVAAAVLAALIALGCLAWGIARISVFEPRWTLSLRHSLAEAAFRASATWAEFSDWVRLGR